MLETYEGEEFVNAFYTSVWEDGTELTTGCRLELNNLRVYDIEDSGDDNDHGLLVDEYVEYKNVQHLNMPQDDQLERIEKSELMFDYKGE